MIGSADNNIKTVPVIDTDEINLLGMLLEKYVPSTTYDRETKIWTVPEEINRELHKHP